MNHAILLAAVLGASAPLAASALELTPSQTEGPYYPTRKPVETDADLTRIGPGPQAQGEVLALRGSIVDPDGKPIPGARIEIWQTDHQGPRSSPMARPSPMQRAPLSSAPSFRPPTAAGRGTSMPRSHRPTGRR